MPRSPWTPNKVSLALKMKSEGRRSSEISAATGINWQSVNKFFRDRGDGYRSARGRYSSSEKISRQKGKSPDVQGNPSENIPAIRKFSWENK